MFIKRAWNLKSLGLTILCQIERNRSPRKVLVKNPIWKSGLVNSRELPKQYLSKVLNFVSKSFPAAITSRNRKRLPMRTVQDRLRPQFEDLVAEPSQMVAACLESFGRA